MQLLSIKLPDLSSDSYISAFRIKTWGINIHAMCKFPVGWMITAGRELNMGGQIVSSASGFMTNLNVKQLEKLTDFVLIDDLGTPHDRSATEPPAFSDVFIQVGEYHSAQRDRRIRLKGSDIVLTDATRCPSPPPE
jgi:hypothetical protein